MRLCKIRFDGCHYLAMPYTNISNKYTTDEIINASKEDLNLSSEQDKKAFFVNEWAEIAFPYLHKGRKKLDDYLVKIHNTLKEYYYLLIEQNKKNDEIIHDLKDMIYSDYDFIEFYDLENSNYAKKINDYIEKFVERERENLINRKKLFKRKALNNEWNYFVTFTYDDKKHDEDSFVKSLKKKLQNLHTNYNWLYMGCFERSKTGRLHFHGLVYVPPGTMRGSITKVDYYDTTSHKKAVSYINSEFEDKLGRNDFKPISKLDYTFSKSLDYILKYIGKSGNKIVYSRGIKDDVMGLVDFENNVICKLSNESPYLILADDNFEEVSDNLNKI